MLSSSRFAIAFLFTIAVCGATLLHAQSARNTNLQISVSATTSPQNEAVGSPAIQFPETDPGIQDALNTLNGAKTQSTGIHHDSLVNRSFAKIPGVGSPTLGNQMENSTPELQLSFDGLNFFDQRFANHGNQFSVEPPDQGLCVGNGFVLETVNDVLRISNTSGNALATTDLNTFYGYIPAIVRSTGKFGPEITDPSCIFDKQTRRWFHVVLTLDRVGTTSKLAGTNHLDLAVSTTDNPLGTWKIYRIPVQNDGTQGTPNHHCAGGPCIGDYPHIGADANGVYLTTNEFPLFAPGFIGAQIYALSKRQLVAGASLTVVLFNTADPGLGVLLDGNPGFTVWPAQGNGQTDTTADSDRGTEFLLSSIAVFSNTGTADRIRVWSLKNTQSLNSASPNLTLSASTVRVKQYSVPPLSTQKASGDIPQAQCLSNNTLSTPFGIGCWRFFFTTGGPFPNVEKHLESNDSRMQQVFFAQGKLWAALDTAVKVGGSTQAGIAFFAINPLSNQVVTNGTIAVANNNVTYPAVAVLEDGQGVIAFTLVGRDHFPSAAYATLNATSGAGNVHVAAEGIGPDDGFTGYNPTAAYSTRPRWGDYGSAATDGETLWIASEYIAQKCGFATYISSNFTCGNTRGALGNWGTRISQLAP